MPTGRRPLAFFRRKRKIFRVLLNLLPVTRRLRLEFGDRALFYWNTRTPATWEYALECPVWNDERRPGSESRSVALTNIETRTAPDVSRGPARSFHSLRYWY